MKEVHTQSSFDSPPPDRNRGPTVLIVDDEQSGLVAMRKAALEAADPTEKPTILEARDLETVRGLLDHHRIDVVLLDKTLITSAGQKDNAILAIPEILQSQPLAQILVVTISEDMQDAVTAGRLGAFGFVSKGSPFALIVHQIRMAIRMSELERQRARQSLHTLHQETSLAGRSPVIRQIVVRAQAVAESNRPVLLLGETGTGKTTLARLIHEHRKKYLKERERPFVALNIAALAPDLAERELFGNERGAFTDAKDLKLGFIELANNGTLFLDEIGDASPDLQVKLLKVLEEGKFYRLGGSQVVTSQFKLVCATHHNLEQRVREGRFREDLFMRISTFQIEVPSLDERRNDIPDIIRAALPKWCQENSVRVTFEDLPSDFIEYVMERKIPGNIRGLEQMIARLLVLSPRDKAGRPVLTSWRETFKAPKGRAQIRRGALSLDEILRSQLDVVGPEFPGLRPFIDAITDKVYEDASRKHDARVDMARALRIHPSAITARFGREKILKADVPARDPKVLQ